jgi:hypothetical protein
MWLREWLFLLLKSVPDDTEKALKIDELKTNECY